MALEEAVNSGGLHRFSDHAGISTAIEAPGRLVRPVRDAWPSQLPPS